MGEAMKCLIEDFFRIRWQAVVWILVVLVGIIDLAYVRTVYGSSERPPYWAVHTLLQTLSFLAIISARSLFK